jgi:virginiamycin A acetyltransferase
MLKCILRKIYALDNGKLRKYVLKYIARMEGGQPYSATIRKIIHDYHRIDIGMYSYGGCFSTDNVPDGTIVGRYCSFASEFTILNGNHPAKFKSQHPFFYNPAFGYVKELLITRSKLVIENDVWIGHGAIILPAVTLIENGATIGAGSVVTKNVPPYAVVAGNPATIITYRFKQETIDKIQKTQWWRENINDIKINEDKFGSFMRPL